MTADAADSPPARRRAWGSLSAWATLLAVVAAGLALDLGTKRVAFESVAGFPVRLDRSNPTIPYHDPVRFLPVVLDLHLVKNEGAVFGIGANQRVFFIFFTVAALGAAFVVFGRWTGARDHAAHVAIGLILAGGLGNLYDRVTFSVVRDFLHLFPRLRLPFGLRWPGGSDEVFPWVFNLADVMLLAGMGLLMLHINRLEKKRKLAGAAAGGTEAGSGAGAGAGAGGGGAGPGGQASAERPLQAS